jgi:ABC-2 type transport system permease protein
VTGAGGPEPVAARESATGAIYDLGYRSYAGPRLGRSAAVATLFWHSVRAAFAWGKSGRAKLVPWGLSGIALAPAAVATAISALVPPEMGGAMSPFNYDNYMSEITVPIALFVAAQAPELVSSDQRNRVLSLYFSHALARTDYALAKLAAMVLATFILAFAPMLVLFLGNILVATDVPAAFGDQLENVPQVLFAPLIYALPASALALAIAAWTPRRAYATGAIIAVFMVSAAVAGILEEATGGRLADLAPLINPFNAADGTRDLLVGDLNPESSVAGSDLDLWVYGLETLVITGIAAGAVLFRYRRVAA